MPNKNTFDMKCVGRFISAYRKEGIYSVDPFANKNRLATVTNDLDPEMKCDYSLDALEFMKMFDTSSVDLVYYDPPYSPRQVAECYKRLGRTVNMETTQASFWGRLRDEVARILRPGGVCLSFGWNSNGIGSTRGFEIKEILIVAHGGQHNDTICVAETKNQPTLNLFSNDERTDSITLRSCG